MNISNKNYFELFSLSESFQIDSNLLNQEYKKLQAQYHPDTVVGADDSVRLQALQISSIVNDAYTVLNSPLKLAAYLLTLHQVDPEENNQAHLGNEFLFSQIELRERLENIEKKSDMDELDQFKRLVEKDVESYLKEFETQYKQADYTNAKPIYNKLQFLYKLLSEVDALEETLLEY